MTEQIATAIKTSKLTGEIITIKVLHKDDARRALCLAAMDAGLNVDYAYGAGTVQVWAWAPGSKLNMGDLQVTGDFAWRVIVA